MTSNPMTKWILTTALLATACTDDPIYVDNEMPLEVGADGVTFAATASLALPVRIETSKEAADREMMATELGAMVPFVLRDDLDLSLEWRIENLSDQIGVARLQLNGANEWFAYVPAAFVVDPEEEEAPPPLAGDVPLEIAPGAVREGVIREDQLAEASLDLELITRGGLNPFAALLDSHEDLDRFDAGGVEIPSDAFASLVRLDITLIADQHMLLTYSVRARDHRDPHLLHDRLFDAPAAELTAFAPADFAPAPP